MTLYYISTAKYTAVAQFAVTHAYVLGDIVRQLAAPAFGSERCFRCTTAGTSGAAEVAWALGNGSTTTQGTAVFTCDTGFAWTKPHFSLQGIYNQFTTFTSGDTMYIGHDHNLVTANSVDIFNAPVATANPVRVICVNSAGSVPPVSADFRFTAVESTTGANFYQIRGAGSWYFQGITFSSGTGASASFTGLVLGKSSSNPDLTFESCTFIQGINNINDAITTSVTGIVRWNNCTVQFANVGQGIMAQGRLRWTNTPSAIVGATIPTRLFLNPASVSGTSNPPLVTCDGVDLSALNTTLVIAQSGFSQINFNNCKLNAAATIAATPTLNGARIDVAASDSGATGFRQESYQYSGTLTAETTFTLVGGATDGVMPISWKIVTNANATFLNPVEAFQIARWNTAIGAPLTATIELESNATLTSNDAWVEFEVLSTAGFPISGKTTTKLDILAVPTNLAASTAIWNGALAGATKQKLTASFTPQIIGLVRATVFIGKASQTVYMNPAFTLA